MVPPARDGGPRARRNNVARTWRFNGTYRVRTENEIRFGSDTQTYYRNACRRAVHGPRDVYINMGPSHDPQVFVLLLSGFITNVIVTFLPFRFLRLEAQSFHHLSASLPPTFYRIFRSVSTMDSRFFTVANA